MSKTTSGAAVQPREGYDPITFELIKNAVATIADEMALTILRTAYSGALKDNMDFSTGLCMPNGELFAQGPGFPLHLGSIPDAMLAILDRYPPASIRPGDVFILNDPFEGGTHLPDFFIFKPIFVGDRLSAFGATVAHHTDVGGRVPGSNAADSTEVYAEGLRVPILKFYEAGRPNETLVRLIEKNVRVPDKVLGDLRAQVAACTIAERAFLRLAERYGPAALDRYLGELLDYAERMARAEIAGWPDGVYTFTDYIDDDGIDDRPIPINVRLEVRGDSLIVDFAGTSPQVRGAINAPLSYVKSAVYLTVRSVMETAMPNNAGYFRPIAVRAPVASLLNPVLPAASGARGLTGFRIIDTMFGALAQVRPDRVPAACEGGNSGVSVGGYDADRRAYIFVEFFCGSGGARPNKDGIDAHSNPGVCQANVPCEIVEADAPLMIEEYGFMPDSGGPGKYRGGLALVRQYRFLGNEASYEASNKAGNEAGNEAADEATLQVRSDRRRHLPWGLAGGKPGRPSQNVLNPGGDARLLPTKFTTTIKRGDVFRHVQPGGGGYGDPLERDPAAVREDVLDGKISLDHARREYGVVLDAVTRALKTEETVKLRESLAAQQCQD